MLARPKVVIAGSSLESDADQDVLRAAGIITLRPQAKTEGDAIAGLSQAGRNGRLHSGGRPRVPACG